MKIHERSVLYKLLTPEWRGAIENDSANQLAVKLKSGVRLLCDWQDTIAHIAPKKYEGLLIQIIHAYYALRCKRKFNNRPLIFGISSRDKMGEIIECLQDKWARNKVDSNQEV